MLCFPKKQRHSSALRNRLTVFWGAFLCLSVYVPALSDTALVGSDARFNGQSNSEAPTLPYCVGPARQVELACQSWTEIARTLKQGDDEVILPVGGTEQSGPYMAVGKHNARARILADRIALKLGHTYVAPVISYVPEGSTEPRTGHMRFPGTISIPPLVFVTLVEAVAESLRVQGFRKVILLGDHGGYQKQLAYAVDILNKRWANKPRVAVGNKSPGRAYALFIGSYYTVISTRYADLLRQRGYGDAIGTHAGLSDTSLMLATDPSFVRQKELARAPKPNSADGVYGGDPRQASVELGRVGCDMQVQEAVETITAFNRRHP